MKSTIDAFDNIFNVLIEGNLRFTNQNGSVSFRKLNKPDEFGGVNSTSIMDERLIRTTGSMIRLRDHDQEVDSYYAASSLIVASLDADIEHIIDRYGSGRANNTLWFALGSEKMGDETVYYFNAKDRSELPKP